MITIEYTTCYTISGSESFEQGRFLNFVSTAKIQEARAPALAFSRERERVPNYQLMEKPNVLKLGFCFEQNNLLYKNGHSKKNNSIL